VDLNLYSPYVFTAWCLINYRDTDNFYHFILFIGLFEELTSDKPQWQCIKIFSFIKFELSVVIRYLFRKLLGNKCISYSALGINFQALLIMLDEK
jgi:hypothetical protein